MLDPNLVAGVNNVRSRYLEVVKTLAEVPSFRALLAGSERLGSEWKECLRVAELPRVKEPCAVSFSCAFVGSSGHGKTTLLAEMFPDLQRRGWLETGANDTTAQALLIRPAPAGSPAANAVTVRSWNLAQIRQLASSAAYENRCDSVVVRALADKIKIDGKAARFRAEEMRQFVFPLEQELRPLPADLVLPSELSGDRAFVRTLMVKEPPQRLRRGAVVVAGGEAFEVLALRAAVKEVEVRDPFSEVLRWTTGTQATSAGVAFIDTPGLRPDGTARDEVLRHVLSKKNEQILIELLRQDDLDVIVYVVLNPGPPALGDLVRALREQCRPEDLAGLGDRLILAVNGTHRSFTDAEHLRQADPFAPIEDALEKMGRLRPARICFLDSRRVVEARHGDYRTFYGRYRQLLESWCASQGALFRMLQRRKLADSLHQNIDALCDPEDRGQGHLVRQVFALLGEKGPRWFVRKHLVRTRLLAAIRQLREALRRNYDESGKLNAQAIQDAIRQCLSVIQGGDLGGIERFAEKHLDPAVDQVVPAADAAVDPKRWVQRCFTELRNPFFKALARRPGVSREAAELFARLLPERLQKWHHAWGYATARMPPPTSAVPMPAELLRHCLKIHVREMLYQLVTDGSSVSTERIVQEKQDQERIAGVLETVDRLLAQAEKICKPYGEAQ
jgi:hypothetical protein